MTAQSSWEDLASDFGRLGQTVRADWFASEGREEYGIWLLRPEGSEAPDHRASFSLIAAKAVEKSGISPTPLPQPLQHDPQWDLYCQSINLSDAVPYGLGEVDRDAVDTCTRAWLDLLRIKSPTFRSSEGRSWVKGGTECRTYTGNIRNVCGVSATYCTLRARDEIEARLTGRVQEDEQTTIAPEVAKRRAGYLESLAPMPEPHRTLLEADLRRINSKLIEREIDKGKCLRDSYDAFANSHLSAGEALTEEALAERIPALLFETGLEFSWLTREEAERDSFYWSGPVNQGNLPPIPDPAATLGSHTVQEAYRDWFFGELKGRIEDWRGVARKQSAQRMVSAPIAAPTASGGDGPSRLGDNRGAMPTDFWESLRLDFIQLRADCAIDPPLKPAGRLTALWTAQQGPGRWRLEYWNSGDGLGVARRFEWSAQSAAARLGVEEKGEKAVWFWLDRLTGDAPESHRRPLSNVGLDGIEELFSVEILDICGLSADYCRKCAADEMIARNAVEASQPLPIPSTLRQGTQAYRDDFDRFVKARQRQGYSKPVPLQAAPAPTPTAIETDGPDRPENVHRPASGTGTPHSDPPYWDSPTPLYYFDRWPLTELSTTSQASVRGALLQIHGAFLNDEGGDRPYVMCWRRTLDAIAGEFFNADLLSEQMLMKTISGIVADATASGRWVFGRRSFSCPTGDFTEQMGTEFWSPEFIRIFFRPLLEGSITAWRGRLVAKASERREATDPTNSSSQSPEAVSPQILKTGKKRGRRANVDRRDAIRNSISKHGDQWRDYLSEIFSDLDGQNVSMGDFQGTEVDLGDGERIRAWKWADLDLAVEEQRRQIIDVLRKYTD